MDKLVSVSRKPTALSPSSISLRIIEINNLVSEFWQMNGHDNPNQMSNMFYDGFIIRTAQKYCTKNIQYGKNRLDCQNGIKGDKQPLHCKACPSNAPKRRQDKQLKQSSTSLVTLIYTMPCHIVHYHKFRHYYTSGRAAVATVPTYLHKVLIKHKYGLRLQQCYCYHMATTPSIKCNRYGISS